MSYRWDDNGWLIGSLQALDREQTWTLFSPEAPAIIHAERLEYQARRFFAASLKLDQVKNYPGGASPRADVVRFRLNDRAVALRTLPIDAATSVYRQAQEVAHEMGGAGMDVVLSRAHRVWQVEPAHGEDVEVALTTLAILASLWLGPILPPRENRLLGVKSARERIAALPQTRS